MTIFSDKIKEARKEKQLTQKQAAEYMHMSESTLSRYESGKIEPTVEIAKQFSDLYDIPVHELTDGKEPVLKAEIKKENMIDAFFESKHGQYIFYMILMALSAAISSTGLGIIFVIYGLYYARKKKFSKIVIVLNAIYLVLMGIGILEVYFGMQIWPHSLGYTEL